MKKYSKWIVLFVSLILVFSMLYVCASGQPAPPLSFTISAGAVGQNAHMLAAFLGNKIVLERPGSKITAMAGGMGPNPKLVGQGVVEFGITSSNLLEWAITGKWLYDQPYDLYSVANLTGPGAYYFMVKESTGLTSIKQMIDEHYPLKFATFVRGGSPEIATQQLFDEYGITYEDIESWGGRVEFMQWTDAISYLRDGHIDALLGSTAVPSAFHAEFASFTKTRILPLDQNIIDNMCRKYGYEPFNFPVGLFGVVTEPTPTFGYTQVLFTRGDVSEDSVYTLTKTIYENASEIPTVHNSYKEFRTDIMTDVPGKLHPGAERFYKEVGLIK